MLLSCLSINQRYELKANHNILGTSSVLNVCCLSINQRYELKANHNNDFGKVCIGGVEDIGIVMLDHKHITITQALMEALLDNNVALITCSSTHHPVGLMLPLSVNTLQNERFRIQSDATEPLKKQLWAQCITQKIKNQAALLAMQRELVMII